MLRNYSLAAHNSFGLDIVAAWAQKIKDLKDLENLMKDSVFHSEKILILGGGSNCLFLDDYYDGLVILMENKGSTILEENDEEVLVSVAAGEDWSPFVDRMVVKGFGGLENLSLIPGKVGAAPMQNIGAYGAELKDVFVKLLAIDLFNGNLVEFDHQSCELAYRSSIFKTNATGRYGILSVDFRLKKNAVPNTSYHAVKAELSKMNIKSPNIAEVAKAVKNIRRRKLPDPLEIGNAGSFFKNPLVHNLVFENLKYDYPDLIGFPESAEITKISAGWLIEKAGWKGKKIGSAGVYPNQALVLVNYGNATGRDIYSLAMEIRHDVNEMFGIILEPEVNII